MSTSRIWKTTNGRQIPICQLTSEHLCNILNWIERTPPWARVPNQDQRTEDYFWLRTEAINRGLRWRRYAGSMPLRDGDISCGPLFTCKSSPDQPSDWFISDELWAKAFGSVSSGAGKTASTQGEVSNNLDWYRPVALRLLKAGEKFRVRLFENQDIHMKLRLFGDIATKVRLAGYVLADYGEVFYNDSRTGRCAVANMRTGDTYWRGSAEAVQRVGVKSQ